MRAEIIIAVKDLRLLMRDKASAFFTFAFPLAVAFFFGFVFGGGGETQAMKVACWNAGSGPAAAAFVKALADDGSFELSMVAAREEGEALVRGGKAAALIAIPENFDARSKNMMSGDGPEVELLVDPSRKAEAGLITGKLAQVSFQSMMQGFTNPDQLEEMISQVERGVEAAGLPQAYQRSFRDALQRLPELVKAGEGASTLESAKSVDPMKDWMPIKVHASELKMSARAGHVNPYSISFLQGIAWGLFGAVLSFTGSMVDERERGTLMRLLAAPLRPLQVLVGKAMACFVTCVVVEVMLVSVGVLVCGVTVHSIPLFVLATLCTAFAFTGIMMALAACFRTQGGAQGAGRAVLLVLAMIGGGTIPLFFMPKAMQIASSVSPFKWAITAAEGATWRAWSLQESVPALSVLLAVGFMCTVVSAVAIKRRFA